MTDSLSRLLALPFALIIILVFTYGDLASFGLSTVLVLISLIALALAYVFNKQIDIWWYKRKPPKLDKPLVAWISIYSNFYKGLSDLQKRNFQDRIATFNQIKNFTLKGKRDYQLEEDIKTIISHEMARVTFGRPKDLLEEMDNIIVYNHPFATPNVQSLHALELYPQDGVIVYSKEQLVNGFLNPKVHLNISLLAAVMTFIQLNPRLAYPSVTNLEVDEIYNRFELKQETFFQMLGVDWLNKLDLLCFCYFSFPDRMREYFPEEFDDLNDIFKSKLD